MPNGRPDGACTIPGQPVPKRPAEQVQPKDTDKESVAPPPAVRRKGKSERQYVFEGMEILYKALIPFVEGRLEDRRGGDWQGEIARQYRLDRDEDGRIFWDQAPLLNVIDEHWVDACRIEGMSVNRDDIQKLRTVRNNLSHYKEFNYKKAEQALDRMFRLTKAVGESKAATRLDEMRNAFQCIWGNDFKGFPFRDVDFGHPEGKKVLSLAMDQLRDCYGNDLRTLGIDPRRPGRDDPQIHDDGGPAWNVFFFKEDPEWRKNPHLTLGIGHEYVSAMATLPHKAERVLDRLKDIDEERLRSMVKRVRENMRLDPELRECDGMESRLRVRQRPAHSVRRPLMAAHIDVDLCTLDDDGMDQPQWIDAVLYALIDKKSNPELQIGARFPYRTCPKIAGPDALDCVAQAWIACKPYIDLLFECKNAPAA